MYTDDILKEKYRAQADIARANDFDIKRIAEEASRTVAELSKKFNIKLDYFSDLDAANTA